MNAPYRQPGHLKRWAAQTAASISSHVVLALLLMSTPNWQVLCAPAAPQVIDINPGLPDGMSTYQTPGFASRFVTTSTQAFFAGIDGTHGRELWVTDGTKNGTRLASDLRSGAFVGSNPIVFASSPTLAYFTADDGVNGCELWRSDGTAAGTFMLADIEPGPKGFCNGVSSGIAEAKTLPDGKLLFIASNSRYGREPWVSDGTANGTQVLADISLGATGSNANHLVVAGTHGYFLALDAQNSYHPWVTDGTPNGTHVLQSADGSLLEVQSNTSFVPIAGSIVFGAHVSGGNASTYGLWSSDGTTAGTRQVLSIKGSAPGNISPECNGRVLFQDGSSGFWVTDGTPNGSLRFEIQASFLSVLPLSNSACFKGVLYFAASANSLGVELWRSDGTAAGTFMLKDINPGASDSYPNGFVSIGSRLLFKATTAAEGEELWGTDGTTTSLIADIWPYTRSSAIDSMVAFGGIAYFTAMAGSPTSTLWYSDGTTPGTRQVNVDYPSAASTVPAIGGGLTVFNERLLYQGSTQANGSELWSWQLAPPPSNMPPGSTQGMWWATGGTESGWGLTLTQQADTIFVAWFTYDFDGTQWWLTATAVKAADGGYVGEVHETTGPAFSAVPFDPKNVSARRVGSLRLAFSDANSGTFAYTVKGISQSKRISRLTWAADQVPVCHYPPATAPASASNYQDMWWVPGGAESGWGLTLTQQGDTIFLAWFTYDLDGRPWWLVATLVKSGERTFAGQLMATSGPAFSADPFEPGKVTRQPVGDAIFEFSDGNTGTFNYTLGGVSQSKAITRFRFAEYSTVCQ